MTRVLVPYHLDEHLPDLDIPAVPETSVTVDLPDGDAWARMASLYERVAAVVAGVAGRGDRAASEPSEARQAVKRPGQGSTGAASEPSEARQTVQRPRGEDRPVIFSGDCTTSLGVVAGLQRAGLDPAVVWFDAHGDVQTPETSTSGYLGGMPLRLLTGYRPELIAASLGLRPVPEHQIMLVGARDLDPPELTYLEGSAIRRHPVTDVPAAPLPDRPLYLHVDLDVVDPADLPGLLFPAPGGPGVTEVTAALHRVVATGRVAALGLACTWRPGPGAADPLRQPVADLLARLAAAAATPPPPG